MTFLIFCHSHTFSMVEGHPTTALSIISKVPDISILGWNESVLWSTTNLIQLKVDKSDHAKLKDKQTFLMQIMRWSCNFLTSSFWCLYSRFAMIVLTKNMLWHRSLWSDTDSLFNVVCFMLVVSLIASLLHVDSLFLLYGYKYIRRKVKNLAWTMLLLTVLYYSVHFYILKQYHYNVNNAL